MIKMIKYILITFVIVCLGGSILTILAMLVNYDEDDAYAYKEDEDEDDDREDSTDDID